MSKLFRQSFDFTKLSKDLYQWFPGHMARGLKKMYEELPNVDAVIEVHDARIPLTGRNSTFRRTVVGNKPYAFVLNKADLADLSRKSLIAEKLKEDGYYPCFFTSLRSGQDRTTRQILPNLIGQIEKQFRFNREFNTSFNVLVVGVPNVGKSTLINRFRNIHMKKANAVRVGAEPGITRAVQTKVKISNNPPIFVLDSPGVLEPTFDDIETGFKLACLNCVKNHEVNADLLADYLLYKLNKSKQFDYVDHYGLAEPTDSILDVLIHIARVKKKTKTHKAADGSLKLVYDVSAISNGFVKSFFDGNLGKMLLDDDKVQELESQKTAKSANDAPAILDLDKFV